MNRIATIAFMVAIMAMLSPVSARMGGNDGIEVEAALARARAGSALSEHDKGLLERYGCTNSDSQFCRRLFGTSARRLDSKRSQHKHHRHHRKHDSDQ